MLDTTFYLVTTIIPLGNSSYMISVYLHAADALSVVLTKFAWNIQGVHGVFLNRKV
jgi:hypothetical protein